MARRLAGRGAADATVLRAFDAVGGIEGEPIDRLAAIRALQLLGIDRTKVQPCRNKCACMIAP